MVEATANSVEDFLIDGLSFKLKKGASYINERKSVTYHPQGSNYYSTSGTKLIKMLITGQDAWLDPSTFRIAFDLVNGEATEAKQLRVLGAPWTFFRRLRVLVGGQLIEDIDDYGRLHQMFSVLTAKDSRTNELAEGFGKEWDLKEDLTTAYTAASFPGIPGGQSRTVLFKPLSGLLNQEKYLPVRYSPITIELELVNDASEPVVSYLEGTNFTEENTSTLWSIQNVQAKCDLVVLDNALDNSYAEHLLSGKALPINYNTYISQIQSTLSGNNIGQRDIRHNITRSISRLKALFITFDKAVVGENTYIGRKAFNDFYSPMMNHANWNQKGEFECQVQLGSKNYPEYPIRSHSESMYQLRKTLGVQSSSVHSFDVDAYEYTKWNFIIGIDMEKQLGAAFTGMNSRAGDILSIHFKNSPLNAEANYPTSMHTILVTDNIMEIRDGGVTVFD